LWYGIRYVPFMFKYQQIPCTLPLPRYHDTTFTHLELLAPHLYFV